MESNKKKAAEILSGDALRKAMSSWRRQVPHTDFDEFDTPLRADIAEELHRPPRSKEN